MSIYPDKKDGKLTGRFCVEVQQGARRLRARCDNIVLAKRKEDEFKKALSQALVTGEPVPASRKFNKGSSRPETLAEGIRKAEGRLWHGKDGEALNFTRLGIMKSIIGSDTQLDAIDTETLDELTETLQTTRGIGDSTINRYLSALHVFLTWCKERKYRTVELPKFEWRDEDEGRIRWITADEEEPILMAKLRYDVPMVVRNAIVTGMRRGEILSLEKDQFSPGWVHLWETKTNTPRSVPLTPQSEEELRWLVANNAMPDASKLRYEWQLARDKMGLGDDPFFVFHACRHTCATRLVQANVNLRVVQKFMGHKRIETTLRYAHINDTMLTDALGTLVAFQSGQQSHRGLQPA